MPASAPSAEEQRLMPSSEPAFQESQPWTTPIRDLGLTIAGSALEPILAEFEAELEAAGIRRVRPRFYLSTEWGVPDGTIAIAIPFYLARPELTALHAERGGHVEGGGRADILRYLRHEMGHVVNYAYRLYETEEWVEQFGSIDAAVPGGVPPRAVQPAVRPPPPRLVCPEAPRRGLVRDLRRLDDPRPQLARRLPRVARGPGQAALLRPDHGRAGRPRPGRDGRRPRRGRGRAGLLGGSILRRPVGRPRGRSPPGSTPPSARSSRTWAIPSPPPPTPPASGPRR